MHPDEATGDDTGGGTPPPPPGEAEAAASPGLVWHLLEDFRMEFQVQTNWCWAAVATSVDAYYRHGTGAPMPMCEVANSELGRTDCCTTGAAGPCNVYGTLASALFRVGHGGKWGYKVVANRQHLATEIDNLKPLCFRTAAPGGGAHFIAAIGHLPGSGATPEQDRVAIADSWNGSSDMPYDMMKTGYTTGICTDTYYTRP